MNRSKEKGSSNRLPGSPFRPKELPPCNSERGPVGRAVPGSAPARETTFGPACELVDASLRTRAADFLSGLKAGAPARGAGESKPELESVVGAANAFAVAVAAEEGVREEAGAAAGAKAGAAEGEFMGATDGDGTDWSGARNALG